MYPRSAQALVALGDVAPTGGRSAYDGTRDAFLSWVRAVTAAGGVATVYPYHGTLNVLAWSDIFSDHDTYGTPAARYPAAIAAQFDNEPDQLADTPRGTFAYYLAPPGAVRWAMSPAGMLDLDQMRKNGTDQSPEEATEADWFKKLKTALKLGAVAGVAILGLQLLQYLPRPKDWE